MSQIQVKIYVCVDEHGNYRAVGGSHINEQNEHQALAIVEETIKNQDVKTTTTSFKVNIELPS